MTEALIIRVCSRDDPVGGCAERLAAMAAGTFVVDFDAWGWCSTETPLRYMSDNAFAEVYIHRAEYSHPNNTRVPYTYTVCPWCFQELPALGLLRKFQEKQALGQ
jgi:hypothetical protein